MSWTIGSVTMISDSSESHNPLRRTLGLIEHTCLFIIMDRTQFWNLVEAARTAAADAEARVVTLEQVLSELTREDLESFQRNYDAVIHEANRWDLWGAAYLMNGGCSDDGFRYFCHWLISEGQQRFERSLHSPDSLADLPRQDCCELEAYAYVAAKLYESKFGAELDRDFTIESAPTAGEEWSEDELPQMFPRLAEKYEV